MLEGVTVYYFGKLTLGGLRPVKAFQDRLPGTAGIVIVSVSTWTNVTS